MGPVVTYNVFEDSKVVKYLPEEMFSSSESSGLFKEGNKFRSFQEGVNDDEDHSVILQVGQICDEVY